MNKLLNFCECSCLNFVSDFFFRLDADGIAGISMPRYADVHNNVRAHARSPFYFGFGSSLRANLFDKLSRPLRFFCRQGRHSLFSLQKRSAFSPPALSIALVILSIFSTEILRVLLAFECCDLLRRRNVCAQPFLCWLFLTTEIFLDSADKEGGVFSCRRRDLRSAH